MKILAAILTVGLVGLVIIGWLSWEWGEPWLWPHRWAIFDAFDGNIDPQEAGEYLFDIHPTEAGKYLVNCGGDDCAGFLRALPAASEVCCISRLTPDGACCSTAFGDDYGSEIHIFRQSDGVYVIRLKPSFCRNPEFDPSAEPGSPQAREFVPCSRIPGAPA